MRIAALAFVSLLALGACNPSTSSNSDAPAAAANDATPPQASGVAFRQEATLTIGGQSIHQIIYHDGARIRTEMPSPAGGSMTSIVNSETHEAISIMQIGGRTMATRTDLSQVQSGASQPVDIDALRAQMQARTHRVGDCSAGGENGSEWSVEPPPEVQAPAVARTMCLTNDGIMIQMKQDGVIVFDTTSLQRGPQDASLFAVPPGVQVTETHLPSRESVNAAIERARAAAAGQGTP
ncbi:MAG: hypothetical protein NT015_13650 [Alphaproteobacteria bacterium]|nr:hypothetical protein [Alphaproteobacteria bacterium]